MRLFILILIVFNGLMVSGYPLVDVLLLSCFLFGSIIVSGTVRLRINSVLIFCLYIILQVLRGMYVLNDYRMVYWILFFVVLYFAHLYFVNYYSKIRPDIEYVKTIFKYSWVYFFIYGLVGLSALLILGDAGLLQGTLWIGSSGAFIVCIPYICSHFSLFKTSGYSLSGLSIASIFLYALVSDIHQSRAGLYLLFVYLLFLALHVLRYKPRQSVIAFSFCVITLLAWNTINTAGAAWSPNQGGVTRQFEKAAVFLNTTTSFSFSQEDLGDDLGRWAHIQAIVNKAGSSPVEFLFGSGWYTSRETLKPFERISRSQYGLLVNHIRGDQPLQVTALAAILSDTGAVGLLFILFFFWRSSKQILKTRSHGRMIILCFLLANWIFFVIGYTFTSILSFLIFLPDGILVSLARVKALPTGHPIRSEIKNA